MFLNCWTSFVCKLQNVYNIVIQSHLLQVTQTIRNIENLGVILSQIVIADEYKVASHQIYMLTWVWNEQTYSFRERNKTRNYLLFRMNEVWVCLYV